MSLKQSVLRSDSLGEVLTTTYKFLGTTSKRDMSGELAPPRKSVELEDPGAKELGMICVFGH